MKTTAILNLEWAYETVSRDLLVPVVKKALNKNTESMVALSIPPVLIKSQEDETSKTAYVAKSVSQWSPLSLTIFNIYMDT